MITIGKIREKSGLLVGVIGGALLLFILGEVIRNMGGTMGEANPRGEIYGEPINEMELSNLIEIFTNNERQMAAQQGREFTDEDARNAEDKAWNEYVRRTLLDFEFNALGIEVSEEEIDAFIFGTNGAQQNPLIAQYFPDSLGMGVDMNLLTDFVNKAEDNEQVQNGVDELGQPTYFSYAEFWQSLREEIASQRKAMKYVALVEKGNFVTSLEAKDDYFAKNETKNISYVFRPYFSAETNDFQLSDEQFQAFYTANKDKKKYEQRASRLLQYVSIDLKPSQDDKERAASRLETLKDAFSKSEQDSLFVMINSQNKQFNRNQTYRSGMAPGAPGTYPADVDEDFQKAIIGDIVGPYINGERVEMAKVLGFDTEKQAWVRHILIKAGGPEISFEAAQAKADSLIEIIKQKNNFVELVQTVSEDPGSIANNGEYKWFQEGQMVPEFNDYSFNAPFNTLGSVKTSYGVHIVEVLGRREAKLPKLAVVTGNVDLSETTILNYEQVAKDFWSVLDENPEMFEEIAQDSNLFVRPTTVFEENPQISGFSAVAQNQILRFGFNKNSKELDISEPIRDGNRYVITQLKKVKEKGAPDMEDARQLMETDAKNEILAERFINEMKGMNDLNKVSSKYDLPVQNAEVTFAVANIGNSGNEPKVVGALFSGLKDGQTTTPIAGKQGIFVVKIMKTVDPMTTTDYSASQSEMLNRLVNSASRNALQGLMKYADVKDYRTLVRIGAR